MPFNLVETLRSLSTRNPGRTEADVQSMVREVLVYGGFALGGSHVRLEQPLPDRRRIDVAVGALLIECKRDLRSASRLAEAEEQLDDYLKTKSAGGGTYAGVLTDGVIWRMYRHEGSGPVLLSTFTIAPASVDERAFRWWLGAILATERHIVPTSASIEERLGARSPSYQLARSALLDCWADVAAVPVVRLKRELWSKMLKSALGTQVQDTDEFFAEHTYLVLLANLIAHQVAGFNLDHPPATLLSGSLFEHEGILGIGEAGFFDWVLESPLGSAVVADVARRVSAFAWDRVEHDVMKVLYESVIDPRTRHRLGEYYTPDWLAKRMVESAVEDPLNQRVLDPGCGSGTFLFHAVRRYLDAAELAGVDVGEALAGVVTSVFGLDLHPVAVNLAQVTYILAIGTRRLAARTSTLTVAVYLGDSMRWESSSDSIFSPLGDVVIEAEGSGSLFPRRLQFPASVVANVERFDHFVQEMADRATERAPGSAKRPIGGILNRYAIAEEDKPMLTATYDVLCQLHDDHKDHIWSFFVRNQARPTWLTMPGNRVDVLVGNPPWLAYRFMPAKLQKVFEQRSRERNLWSGGARGRTTQHDLSAFFIARSVELYLKVGGRFGFVAPRAALSRQTYGGFRTGAWSHPGETCTAEFDQPWDLGGVDPEPFPVPSAVVFGKRGDGKVRRLPSEVLTIVGHAPAGGKNDELEITEGRVTSVTGEEPGSVYKNRFRQGAILVPRVLMYVEEAPPSQLGVRKGRRAVRSRRSSLEKPPWKNVEGLEEIIEASFVRPAYLGESIAPFRIISVPEAVIPYDGTMLDGEGERIDRYPGLARWWRKAEEIFVEHRSSEKRTLSEQVDYMHQLLCQFPVAPHRVVYSASGNTLVAARIADHLGVIEHKLYWAPAANLSEARYLTAILNAPHLGDLVRPYQSRGAFGPRDFDKYVWLAPVPEFDRDDLVHCKLVSLAEDAESIAATVDVTGVQFQRARGLVRGALEREGLADALDVAVQEILTESAAPLRPRILRA